MKNELIAFRSVDSEGDIWCEYAFVFKSEDDVRKCFQPDSDFLINIFTDQDDDDRGLQEFEVHEIGGIINSVTFWTEYAHDVQIVRMNEGYIY